MNSGAIAGLVIVFLVFAWCFASSIMRQDKNTQKVEKNPEFYQEAKRSDFEALEPMYRTNDGKLYQYVGERYVSPDAQAVINHENKRLA